MEKLSLLIHTINNISNYMNNLHHQMTRITIQKKASESEQLVSY
jgi:hypothetical protein